MTWSHVVERDMRERGLKREDTQKREKWRKLLLAKPCVRGETGHKTIVVVVVEDTLYNCCYLQFCFLVFSKQVTDTFIVNF